MRALLAEHEKIRIVPYYVKTHANVYRQVVSGQVAAGGTIGMVLAKERPELQSQLRVLYETPPTYPHPLAVHPRVPLPQREALQQAFLALPRISGGAALLAAIQIPVPVKTTYADYAPLERLGLERYVILKEN
jgi:phosphonate transport system substrate-binding protein